LAKGGKDGVQTFKNVGKETWSLDMGDISYGNLNLEKGIEREGIIDTANFTIAFPAYQYAKIKEAMKKVD